MKTLKSAMYFILTLFSIYMMYTNNLVIDTLNYIKNIIDIPSVEEKAINVSLSFFNSTSMHSFNVTSPVDSPILTSSFGERLHPLTNQSSFHTGIDLCSGLNKSVYSCFDGEITEVGFDDIYGNYVIITHADGYESFYAHLESFYTKDFVYAGEKIGYIGNTGQSTGDHLHFEIRKDKTPINPLELMTIEN